MTRSLRDPEPLASIFPNSPIGVLIKRPPPSSPGKVAPRSILIRYVYTQEHWRFLEAHLGPKPAPISNLGAPRGRGGKSG